ncbi:MAG: hypothetical protein JWM92_142 [Candidatus Nomurabacteria bacterium]|nr:hypothetical protein [Candidatus Nomurabacteria bacterium]
MITTMGVYTTHADADNAITELKSFGIPNDDISYIYTDNKGDIKDDQTGEKVGDGAATGATTGAIIGAIAGFVVANGILPGLGTLIVAGPLATALGFTGAAATTVAGGMTGAVAGGLIGALTGMGVNDEDAKLYQQLVARGDILVITHSDTEGVMDVFERTNAMEIREYHD